MFFFVCFCFAEVTQLEDPRLEWLGMQEAMLRDYLHTAQDALQVNIPLEFTRYMGFLCGRCVLWALEFRRAYIYGQTWNARRHDERVNLHSTKYTFTYARVRLYFSKCSTCTTRFHLYGV